MRHPQLDQILAELRAGLEALYGERLAKLVLYGSQARGDAEEYSDIDVLMILQDKVDTFEEILRTGNLTVQLCLKFGVLVSALPMSLDQYHNQDIGLLRNARREGIPV